MRIILAVVFASLATIAAQAAPTDTPFWTPDQATILRVEKMVSMPPRTEPLQSYSRYYAGITVKGRSVIHGRMVTRRVVDKPADIYIVPENQFPGVRDGGCSVINFFYDLAEDSLTSLECNGDA